MKSKHQWWVGVPRSGQNKVFEEIESQVTPERYPQFEYTVGPFSSRTLATARAKTEKNLDGTFTDPFCNGGKGR